MYNFLVLGIIPGTNLQITFQMWLNAFEALAMIYGIWWLFSHTPDAPAIVSRQPLDASQLHLRG